MVSVNVRSAGWVLAVHFLNAYTNQTNKQQQAAIAIHKQGQKGKAFLSGRDAPALEVAACGFQGIWPGDVPLPPNAPHSNYPRPGSPNNLLLDPVAESGHQAGLGFVQDFIALFHPLNHRCHKNSEIGVVGQGFFLGVDGMAGLSLLSPYKRPCHSGPVRGEETFVGANTRFLTLAGLEWQSPVKKSEGEAWRLTVVDS